MILNDVAIIGGGPSGAYLGYLLACQGMHPVIFDHSHPREKPCGGCLSALAMRKFSILQKTPQQKIMSDNLELIAPDGTSIQIQGMNDLMTVSRLLLDQMLLGEAVNHGCHLITERVENLNFERGEWMIQTQKNMYKSHLVVGADGVQSIVRKKIIGPIPKEHLGSCYGCFGKSNDPQIGRIMFLPGLKGYAWCFPCYDRYNMGIGLEFSQAKQLKPLFLQFIKTYYPTMYTDSTWGAQIPFISSSSFYDVPCAGEQWILVGDAAGHVDPIMGEGIIYALWSAEVAATAIMKGDLSLYDRLWREEYGGRLITNCKLQNLFYKPRLLNGIIRVSIRSRTMKGLVYELVTDWYTFQKWFIKILLHTPRIGIEYIQSKG